jgi:hypothetical protein
VIPIEICKCCQHLEVMPNTDPAKGFRLRCSVFPVRNRVSTVCHVPSISESDRRLRKLYDMLCLENPKTAHVSSPAIDKLRKSFSEVWQEARSKINPKLVSSNANFRAPHEECPFKLEHVLNGSGPMQEV